VYRNQLPQVASDLFMTDGGLETTLIFHEGIDLPYFAAFDLLKDETGTERLRVYYQRYARMANRFGLGLVKALNCQPSRACAPAAWPRSSPSSDGVDERDRPKSK